MNATLCERVAARLVTLHHRTTPVAAVVLLAIVGVGLIGYGLAREAPNLSWAGALVAVTGWYGFLLSGCGRLLAAKDAELRALGK